MSKDYIAIVQCHLIKQRCPGYFCEKAFHERTGGFADLPADESYRTLYLTCGGCCGMALHRRLVCLTKYLKSKEKIDKDQVVVQLSSCITRDNYHGPICPHLDLLETIIGRAGLEVRRDTSLSEKAAKRREEGKYVG